MNRHPDEGSTVILQTAEVLGKTRGPSQEKSAALQEALKGGASQRGTSEKWDFAMKLAFDMSILTAPSKAISQGMRHLDRGSAV